MIKFKINASDIKQSNLVYLYEKNTDLKKLDFLNLDKKYNNYILEKIKTKKNIVIDFYIGSKSFKKLYIVLYTDKKEDILDFLGKIFPKLPSSFSVLSNAEKNNINLLNASLLSRYKYEEYKTEKKPDKLFFIALKSEHKNLEQRVETIKNIFLARDLTSSPSNELTPENFAKQIKKTKWKKSKIKILNYKDIQKKGLGLIEAVGKGSENKPCIVIIEKIVDKKLPTYGLVGKGVTFDSGGIQLKPEGTMFEMKGDMGGAAATFATMKELDHLKLNVNIIACISLAENAISSTSYKPSDIIKSYSGKTVNIIHTDAEGRLILADGVSYISKNYKIDNMITVATLTGACMVGLGFRYAGIMGTDSKTINTILKNSKNSYEKYCEFPFDKYYIDKCKSDIADLENLNRGIYAGSIMGGAFISNFLLNNEKYTHLDIAGTALNSYEPYSIVNKGMTGFGVESLSIFFKGL